MRAFLFIITGFMGSIFITRAQAPVLVKDINTVTPGSSTSTTIPLIAYNGDLYFSPNISPTYIGLCKTNGTSGGTSVVKAFSFSPISSMVAGSNGVYFVNSLSGTNNLWISDGTEAGTVQIKILPGSNTIPVNLIKAVGSLVYFSHNNKLWRSDGTEAGTFELAAFNSAVGSSFSITALTDVNGTLFFNGNTVANGYELWKSDGSIAGTVMVKDIIAGANSGNPGIYGLVGNNLIFSADNGVSGRELWKTDGTEANTAMIMDMTTGSGGTTINASAIIGNTLYFAASTSICTPSCSMGEELYKTDGTEAGTKVVKDINAGTAGSTPRSFARVNNTLYFSATNGSAGTLLWKSDGTEEGTVIVKNILEGFSTASFNTMIPDPVNNRLFFRALGNGVMNLWKSDGTTEGTQIITLTGNADPSPNPNNVTIAGNRAFFTALATGVTGIELYGTNAEATSATLVKDINPGSASSTVTTMAAIGNKVVFHANSLQYGIEPWVSDGTEAGTIILKDFSSASNSSGPANLLDINGTLFFSAANGDVNNNELWKSDGTPGGTVLVKDIWPGLSGSNPSSFCVINGILYFTARNIINNEELWRSDGTEAGTYMVKDIKPGESSGSSPVKLTAMNGFLYFIANHPDFGTELFRSDGTSDGTYMVKDIRPGSSTISAGNTQIFAMGNTLFFGFSDGTLGTELWKTNGTAEGTVMVKDINPGSASGSPTEFYKANGILFFRANDGVNGNELWKTDGTEAGTIMVKDVSPGSGNGNPQQFVEFNNRLVFWGPGGLWESDGTDAGTLKKVDVTGTMASLTNVSGTLFFAGGTSGIVLTKSNLTPEGTKFILNSSPGQGVNSAAPITNSSLLYAAGNIVYFRSAMVLPGGTSPGYEVWKCLNTADTGIFVSDINPGNGNSNPGNFTLSNGNLFFSATAPATGTELYAIPVGGGLPAATTWTGAISTAWEEAGNWSNGVPGTTTAVTIPGGMPRYPVVSVNTSIKSISIQSNASVTLADNSKLILLGQQ